LIRIVEILSILSTIRVSTIKNKTVHRIFRAFIYCTPVHKNAKCIHRNKETCLTGPKARIKTHYKNNESDILNKINNEKDSNAMSALENNLEFIGLVAMIDPPRETSKEAIAICKSAGIKPIMITGDNIKTAIAIAKQLGIYQDGDLALTGIELNKLSDDELNANIEKYSVYARVAPEDKIRIVHA